MLDPRPRRCPALDEVDDERDVHGALDRGAARLALALPVVAVADREQRAGHVDPEVAGRTRTHFRGVHVAAEALGYEGRADLPRRGRDTDRAEHRLQRKINLEVRMSRFERQRLLAPVEVVDPGPLRQRVLQHGRAVGAGQAAEERDRRRHTPVARRLQRGEVQHESVTGLGALDVEGTGLRVDRVDVDACRRQVTRLPDSAGVGVLGPQAHGGAGFDRHDRLDPAEGPGVLLKGWCELDGLHAPACYA